MVSTHTHTTLGVLLAGFLRREDELKGGEEASLAPVGDTDEAPPSGMHRVMQAPQLRLVIYAPETGGDPGAQSPPVAAGGTSQSRP
ncbi:MAG: hypothetical protein RJA70_297 [Pseudomonadota bacterium]|jgi:hypothetical protein